MSCPPNQGVEVGFRYLEVHIQSVEDIKGDIREQVVDHLDIGVSPLDVFGCI